MTKKLVLVTGGTGFLGKNFQKKVNNQTNSEFSYVFAGQNFYGPSRLQYKEETKRLFEMVGPDIILHMAALCGGILANKNSPADFLRDNTQMALNVYETARELNIKWVYSLGSVCAYPKYCPVPFKEIDIWNGSAEETNFPYGQAKRTLMLLGQCYRTQYGIKGAHFVPANMYGSWDRFDLVNSHVIPALIRKFVSAVESNENVVKCWGTGNATREFLYAEDLAELLISAIQNEFDYPDPINVGTGKEISIKDLALLIAKLTGFQGKIEFTEEVSDGQPRRRLDVSRVKELLNFEAKTDLETGLIKVIDWYKDNYLNLS